VGVWECGSVGVWECGSVECGVWECGSVGVWECGSVGVWECGSVGVWECGSVGVKRCILANKRYSDNIHDVKLLPKAMLCKDHVVWVLHIRPFYFSFPQKKKSKNPFNNNNGNNGVSCASLRVVEECRSMFFTLYSYPFAYTHPQKTNMRKIITQQFELGVYTNTTKLNS
jgi:hypothetical protein